jgi:hypothetical protein
MHSRTLQERGGLGKGLKARKGLDPSQNQEHPTMAAVE